ncbi:MAG: RNA polymerase sigma factor [candidate division WOR-3 bacterium]
MNDEDLLLIERYNQGDENAFATLFAKYQRSIYAICYRFVRNEEDARELTQEIFIRIARGIKHFNKKSKFFTWLYRIAVNTCISFKRKYRETEEFNGSMSNIPPQNLILKKAIDDALAKLPPRQRMAFILRHYEGYTFEEIGTIMAISTGAAKANHFQAIRKLRVLLKDWL